MNIETIFFKATDGVDLKGILYKTNNKTKKVLISIHGMATNCIKERDDIIAKNVNIANIDFLGFNNRGHDLSCYIKKENNNKKELAGKSYEEITECYEDILGAIKYALKIGYEEIYIMGHSLGATKTIYAYNKLLNKNIKEQRYIKGIILLSLVDIAATIKIYLKDNFNNTIVYAENLKRQKKYNEIMPEKSFIHPISGKNFLRYSIYNDDINFARFSDNSYEYKELNNIKVPLFMRWGNNRELIIQKAEDLCQILKNKIHNKNLDIDFIDGANHSYEGKEEILGKEIRKFLENIY